MYRTIRVQPANRSNLNISKQCSLDHEVTGSQRPL